MYDENRQAFDMHLTREEQFDSESADRAVTLSRPPC